MPQIKLPDGKKISFKNGDKAIDIAKNIGPKLAKDTIAAIIDGKLVDSSTKLSNNKDIKFVTFADKEGKEVFWHSTSHIMAIAVKELYPETKIAIGPSIENGFYYDFDIPQQITEKDLPKIEKIMNEIIKRNDDFERKTITVNEAKKLFSNMNEEYKTELIDEINEKNVSVYYSGKFVDLCRGPHLFSAGKIKAIKLLKVSGAYWRGDETKPMLQRIYGISFPKKKQLDEYLNMLEEAKRRDHRKIGRELDLFHIDEEIGAGLPLWHPKGSFIRRKIIDFWKDIHSKFGYGFVDIPHISRVDLWKTSGHWDFYRENMYSPMEIDEIEYIVKPMNCPGHIKIYQSKTRSYKDLPIRWAEMGTVYRYERSGVLHGLLRVRGFTQDDAHIFCTPDQLNSEISSILELTLNILKTFGFSDYKIFLSTIPEKYVGTKKNWEKATNSLKEELEKLKLDYEVDPGEGVFYGPKIDIKIKDAIGRMWQCSTIQVDFNLPERFKVTYMGKDNRAHQPIMIHRAILGSVERFIGVLLEHYAGAMPLWLAPEQIAILPIADRHIKKSKEIKKQLDNSSLRSYIDDRTETTGKKVRDAQHQKIPIMVIIGDNEVKSNDLSLRYRDGYEEKNVNLANLIKEVKELDDKKSTKTRKK